MKRKKKQHITFYILMALIIFQGLSGLLGGFGLVIDPTGESLQIPVYWLDNSPFSDYLIPGLILLIVLGFFPLIVFYGLLNKLKWSWSAALILGVALLIWIGVEILVIGYQPKPPLQLVYGAVGILILFIILSSPVKNLHKPEE